MLAGAVAVAEAIEEALDVDALLRWPNDVPIEERKVAGVLVEGFAAAADRWLVAGIGVNVNFEGALPPSIRSTAGSLDEFTGGPVDRALLLRAILRRLDFWWEVLKVGDTTRLNAKWHALSSILGRFVTVESGGQGYRERVVDLDAHFGLVLQMSGGGTRVFAPSKTTLVL